MKRRYHLHPPGLLYCGFTVLILLAALNTQQNLLYWLFGVMLSGVLISGVVSGLMLRRLDIQRLDPRHGTVDEPMIIRYALRNGNHVVPVFNVSIEELPADDAPGRRPWQHFMAPTRAWVMHVGPGETVHGEAVYWPTRRGEVHFNTLRLWTTFPFGLIKKSITATQPQHSVVYPKLYQVQRHVIDAIRPAGPMGMRVTQRPGHGDDYFGMREYREGDTARQIAWKRVAGRDQLVSIDRTRPSPPRLRVILNLTEPLPDDPEQRARADAAAEQAINLAASLLHGADMAGFEVGLTVVGPDLPAVPPRRSHWHLNRMLAILARIDLDAPRDSAMAREPETLERVGLVVVHPHRIDPAIGRPDAWHLSAARMDELVAGTLGFGRDDVAATPSRQPVSPTTSPASPSASSAGSAGKGAPAA